MYDRKLPGLLRAIDDEEMRITLSESLGYGSKSGRSTLTQVRHQVLKHTLGKRCVIEYWLESNGDYSSARRVIGKLYRKNRGERIFKNLQNLWYAAHSNDQKGTFFGMPEPLAYLPELGMVLQNVVPGRQLSSFSVSDDLPSAIRYVVHNLAVLHGLAVSAGEKKTLDDHIKKYCHPGPEALIEACPELAPLVESILNGLARDESLHSAPVCPVHGDLGLAQIFIADDRAFFIDFDGFCLSHAALDIGNFWAAVKVYFGPRSDELATLFLETYLESQSPEMLAGLRTYQAFAYLRRAMICFRLKTGEEWRQEVQQLLENGNALPRQPSE